MDLLHYITYHMTRGHSLSLSHSAPATVVLTFSRLRYALPCFRPLHLLFSVTETVSSPFFHTLSLQSQLKCHFLDEFLFSTASKVAKPLLSYHTLPSISLLYIFYYTYCKLYKFFPSFIYFPPASLNFNLHEGKKPVFFIQTSLRLVPSAYLVNTSKIK